MASTPAMTVQTAEKLSQDRITGEYDPRYTKEAESRSQDDFSDTDLESIDKDAQAGVQKVEAATSVWSKSHLIAAYAFIFLIYFVDSMQSQIGFALLPYVTSNFYLHSLTAATGIMSGIIGGLVKLPLAKILDIWGRPQGFAIMVFVWVLGIIMMAGCNGVQTYAAAQVFYWVGFNGTNYTMSIFIADTSALKNRALMFAFASSPYIATTWIGGPAATSFLNGAGWRWGFAVFAIVAPVICAPLFALFVWNTRKAKKMGVLPERHSGRTTSQSIKYYIVQFDLMAIILLAGGLALFLLPFSLYSYQANGWASPMIICMLVFGILLIIAFVVWEVFFAPVTFMPMKLLADRTVLGSCMMFFWLFISWYIWDSYFYSFLQVNNNLTITQANYVANIYSLGACFWAIIVGILIRYTGRFKWMTVYFGVPLTMLGVGLMIHFRQPDVNIGYIVMCQVFIAVAGGTVVITGQMAAMAAASHQQVAVVLAVQSMFSSIGGAIGQTVAAAIWTGIFPAALREFLPAETNDQWPEIYASITEQLSYPVGSATRTAIQQAYGRCQRYMLIGATCVHILTFISVVVWRDIKVKDFKQVKGRVV